MTAAAPSAESVAAKVEAHARVIHDHIRPIIEGPAWDDLPDTTRRWYLDTAWEAAAGERSTNRATYTPQEQEIAQVELATRRGNQT